MKRVIRRGVFETNSSSTHSLTICLKDTHAKWLAGELLFYSEKEKFISREEAITELKEHPRIKGVDWENRTQVNRLLSGRGIYTYYEYFNDSTSDLETFCTHYKLENGEVVVGFGEFGYDG